MKWIALITALLAVLPLSAWLRRHPNEISRVCMVIGFLPFVLHFFHLYMAIISYGSWPGYVINVAPPTGAPSGWPGYVEGLEVSVLDLLALAVYVSLPTIRQSLPFRIPMALYFLAVLLSALHAAEPKTAIFYSWQLTRMFFVYLVVAKASYADERVVPSILKGMAAGLLVQGCVVIWQRFGLGILRTPGTFSHENLLGMMSEFVMFPFFALVVAGRRVLLPLAVTVIGCVVNVLTLSRAAIGLAGVGFAAVLALSTLLKWTSHKALILLASGLVCFAIVPLAIQAIQQRGDNVGFVSYDFERDLLNREAAAILSDHPLGVGANQYIVAANGGYRQETGQYRTQIGQGSTQYLLIVHNTYRLVSAETGYVGLVTFVFLLAVPLISAFRCSWQNRRDPNGDLLLGFSVALLVVYVHCFFEWVFLIFEPQYMFFIEVGLIAGLAQRLGYWSRLPKKRARFRAFVRQAG